MDMEQIAREIAETYINGNISTAKDKLEELPPLQAALAAMRAAMMMDSMERYAFEKSVERWAAE